LGYFRLSLRDSGLSQMDNRLYGSASAGGFWAGGTVFALNGDGTEFTDLHEFHLRHRWSQSGGLPISRCTPSGPVLGNPQVSAVASDDTDDAGGYGCPVHTQDLWTTPSCCWIYSETSMIACQRGSNSPSGASSPGRTRSAFRMAPVTLMCSTPSRAAADGDRAPTEHWTSEPPVATANRTAGGCRLRPVVKRGKVHAPFLRAATRFRVK